MAVTFNPITPDPGQIVTATITYTGPAPPPTDVHLDVQRPDGSWQALTGYDTLPAGTNLMNGLDLPFSLGNAAFDGTGDQPTLRVRWTWNGVDDPKRNEVTGLTLTSWWRRDLRDWCERTLGFNCSRALKAIGDALHAIGHLRPGKGG